MAEPDYLCTARHSSVVTYPEGYWAAHLTSPEQPTAVLVWTLIQRHTCIAQGNSVAVPSGVFQSTPDRLLGNDCQLN